MQHTYDIVLISTANRDAKLVSASIPSYKLQISSKYGIGAILLELNVGVL